MSATVAVREHKKGYKGLGMEGALARWYARNTGKSIEQFRIEARALAGALPEGASILEVAPGPGFLAIELARLGRFQVTGLDISKTFVEIATENARQAGVAVAFRLGNASAMPFEASSFDRIVCRAAFKNFSEPVRALEEMHRVLKPGGKVLILDLRRDATPREIATEVDKMQVGWLNALFIRVTFKHMLLKRAHSKESFQQMAAQTPFKTCTFRDESIGHEVSLVKS
jgi:ubiquinone/menaquinone biosynthesis C-methylase UbiE